ncbi:MGDG synthase family glycosyltransferase [Cohnella soli]|uniref:Glycosyltransferase n=1 Tax=Cohnella soli TaxID=425005 RepID=A0ABW0I322_9BACL
MNKRRKIFILYASFGEGHRQAASALSQSFERTGGADTVLIDLLAEAHPFLNGVSRFVYAKSYNVMPQLYGWVYETTRDMDAGSPFANWLHSFGSVALRKLIERDNPDAIVHTFPMLVLPTLFRKIGRTIPMFNVITDFDLHRRWLHPAVDKYYVATDDMSKQLRSLGVRPDRIAATGIPIRPAFRPDGPRTGVAAKYGLDERRPIVMVMAPPNVPSSETSKMCLMLRDRCNAQVAVICGRDKTLRDSLASALAFRAGIAVLGFVERIDELMAASRCLITKPGGLTLSEAIAARLPLLLYRPVPGQELGNAKYLSGKGAAVICRDSYDVVRAAGRLLEDDSASYAIRAALEKLRKPDASDRIALDIATQLHIMERASSKAASFPRTTLLPTSR